MKLQTNNLRRLCLWVSLILLYAALLPACATSSKPPVEVTDELLAQIEDDYAKCRYTNGANPEIDGPWRIEYCYGIYSGCVAVMFSLPGSGVLRTVEIAGSVIHYRSSVSIYVWNDGRFFSLENAYNQGLLSKEDVAQIADLHNKR
jgi:hypothetical protein